jgi:MoaA/NifB/PqqE/SkfB family radical SAM enzyme
MSPSVKRAYSSILYNLLVTRRYPMSLVHFVTNRCNARCSFCFLDFDDSDIYKGQLSLEEIERFTQTLGPQFKIVYLTGGEPFLRTDLVDIARSYLRNSTVETIFVSSNGSLPKRVRGYAETLTSEFPDRRLTFSFSVDDLPERHGVIRKIDGLFDSVLESYHAVREVGGATDANVTITVSLENHENILDIYEHLVEERGVRSITTNPVRDEGVYKTPRPQKKKILASYLKLTERIRRDLASGRLEGYDPGTFQGRLANRKNTILHDILEDIYLEPKYVSPCRSGSLFGVLQADGTVRPCEILDHEYGNIRDYDYDFLKLWNDRFASDGRRWILDTNCHCTYECAWAFNILGNWRYFPSMAAAGLGLSGAEKKRRETDC